MAEKQTRAVFVGKLITLVAFGSATACGKNRSEQTVENHAPPSTEDGVSAVEEMCRSLYGAGFAVHCPAPTSDGQRATVEVALSDFSHDRVRIVFDPAGHDAGPWFDGDFPNLRVTSATGKESVEVLHASDGGVDEWDKCLADHEKSVAGTEDVRRKAAITACMKKYPLRYAWFHALHIVAKTIVDGGTRPATCLGGYLCGTGCTPNGATCCIDVGRTDRNCPGGGLCTPDNKCLGGPTPPPAVVGGGATDMCPCVDGTMGCCHQGCCSHHGGIQ